MKVTKWIEKSRKSLIQKYGRGMDEVIFELPDGRDVDYLLKQEGETCCILALTTDQKVILAKQFRPGPQSILREMPGGAIDPSDPDSTEAASRELLEETGYTGDLSFVAKIFVDGYSNTMKHCFVAVNCKKVQEPAPDDNEFIEIELVSLEKFRKHLQSGQLTDVEVGYLTLDHLGLL